jgi:cell division protein ZipA
MDLTIRDWMVIVGVVLIFAVLVDAWRRVRSERYSRVKLNVSESSGVEEGADDAEAFNWHKELPNGGARVVERSDLLRQASAAASREAVEAPEKARAPADSQPETPPEAEADDGPPVEDDVTLVAGMSSSDDEPENLDWLDNMPATDAAPSKAEEPEEGRLPRSVDPEVFMINVVARDPEGFRGEDILHILLACDLRFGDMNFFHRHEYEAGRGAIQFSVANMMQPGVFDIDNMSDFNTPGLVFFVTLPGPDDMMKAFDYMLETAQAVARNLGGDVLDETRSVITKQTLEHNRQQIRDLERRMLAKAQ